MNRLNGRTRSLVHYSHTPFNSAFRIPHSAFRIPHSPIPHSLRRLVNRRELPTMNRTDIRQRK